MTPAHEEEFGIGGQGERRFDLFVRSDLFDPIVRSEISWPPVCI